MEVRLQKPEREDLLIHFRLAPFITEGTSAQTKFIATIAQEFGDFLRRGNNGASDNPPGNRGHRGYSPDP